MSQFPALRPSGRSYSPGVVPVTTFASMSGKETRVITGDTFTSATLALTFQNLEESVANQILSHYQSSFGTFLSFTLPAEVWAGQPGYSLIESTTKKWRYAGPVSAQTTSPGIMTLSVELVSLV